MFLVAYFIYHMVEGDHGLIARDQLMVEVEQARFTLQQEQAERVRLEERADRLRRGELDLDLLDERARVMLNLAGPNDLVLPLDDDF